MSHRNPSDLGRVNNTLFYYIIFTLSTDHVRAPENIQVQIYLTENFSFFTASPVTLSGSLICGSSSSDVMEGSASDDDGLVIEALNKLDDL